MKRGYVYIMTNGPSGTPYVGVTSTIVARVGQHREGRGSDFCREHHLTLVYVEVHDTIAAAITRDKQIKVRQRVWKLNLIGRSDPDRIDLSPTLHLD